MLAKQARAVKHLGVLPTRYNGHFEGSCIFKFTHRNKKCQPIVTLKTNTNRVLQLRPRNQNARMGIQRRERKDTETYWTQLGYVHSLLSLEWNTTDATGMHTPKLASGYNDSQLHYWQHGKKKKEERERPINRTLDCTFKTLGVQAARA